MNRTRDFGQQGDVPKLKLARILPRMTSLKNAREIERRSAYLIIFFTIAVINVMNLERLRWIPCAMLGAEFSGFIAFKLFPCFMEYCNCPKGSTSIYPN